MMEGIKPLSVSITFGDSKVEFSGEPSSVLAAVNEFISKQVPALSLAKKISLSYSASELIEKFGDLIKLTPEGPRVWAHEQKLSDREVVGLQLVASKLSAETGSGGSPSMTQSAISASTGLNSKSVSSRLSEMSKLGYVQREITPQGPSYRITTQGIYWLENSLLRKKATKGQSNQH